MQLGDSNANCCLPSSLSSLAKREPLVVVAVVVQKSLLFFSFKKLPYLLLLMGVIKNSPSLSYKRLVD